MMLLWCLKVCLVHNRVWGAKYGVGALVSEGQMLPSDRQHWFWRETLTSRRQKPGSKLAQCSVVLQYMRFIHKPIYSCIDWGWLCWMSPHPRTDQASPESKVCCNLTDRLCLFPHGFTCLDHDWWSINHTRSPLAHHFSPSSNKITARAVSQLSVISAGQFVCALFHPSVQCKTAEFESEWPFFKGLC